MAKANDKPLPRRGRAVAHLLARHLPFLILLAVLAFHCSRTFGVYFASDDIAWVRRSVADAGRPWRMFGEPVFGAYVRPAFNAVWLLNYTVWGFNASGYQLTLVCIWLAGVVAIYGAGCRLGGRVAGFCAALLVGFNDIYLLMASWKSWYAALMEFCAVAAWFWCYAAWFESRHTNRSNRRRLAGWILLAAAGALAKETTPLVVSAGVLVTLVWSFFERDHADGSRPDDAPCPSSSDRAWKALAGWALISAAVLLLLPSYRGMLQSVLRPSSPGGVSGVAREISAAYVWPRFRSHSASMLRFGLSRYLLLFAVVTAAGRAFGPREKMKRMRARVILGALLLGGAAISIPWGLDTWDGAGAAAARAVAWPAMHALLLGAFLVAAFKGDRWDRVLAVWFVVSLAPALLFRVGSNAYHMPAFAALALYVARAAATFVAAAITPAPRRAAGNTAAGTRDAGRAVLVGIFGLICLWQGTMLYRNFQRVHFSPRGMTVARRVAQGKRKQHAVQTAVAGVLRDAAPDRRVWIAADGVEWIAALTLQERHGFTVETLWTRPGQWLGLRRFDSAARVYTDAMPLDEARLQRVNLFGNGGFEKHAPGLVRGELARTGRYSLMVRNPAKRPRNMTREITVRLPTSEAFLFGGFLRREAPRAGTAYMALASAGDPPYTVRTPAIRQEQPHWELVWECAAPPNTGRPFLFRALEARELRSGAVYADDIFFCPVAPLIAEARAQTTLYK